MPVIITPVPMLGRHRVVRANLVLLVSALSLWSMPVLAQAPSERLPDKDVKTLIDQVDEGRDKFEGNLDSQFKNSTLRGPNGETNVSGVLQDYQDQTKRLQDRFKDSYAASAEVATVLKQAAAIDRYMQGTPSVTKGRSEWDREASSLKHLAGAYGATFPLQDGATVRRINDDETAAAAGAVASAADRFKNNLDKASTLSKDDREAAKKDVELLIRQAEAVKDRTNDDRPATAEVKQLVEQVARVQTFVGAHQIPAAMTDWQSVKTSLSTVQQAFGLTY